MSPLPFDELEALAADPAGDPSGWFVAELRAMGRGPAPIPVPGSELAALLDRGAPPSPLVGVGIETGSTTAAAAAPIDVAMTRKRKTMPITRFVAGFSLAGKIALGGGVALAATTVAAGAGALPGPVQDAVVRTVETVTPFTLHDGGDDAPANAPAGAVDAGSAAAGHAAFGRQVGSDATDGDHGVDGQTVADGARDQEHRSGDAGEGHGPTTPTTPSSPSTTAPSAHADDDHDDATEHVDDHGHDDTDDDTAGQVEDDDEDDVTEQHTEHSSPTTRPGSSEDDDHGGSSAGTGRSSSHGNAPATSRPTVAKG